MICLPMGGLKIAVRSRKPTVTLPKGSRKLILRLLLLSLCAAGAHAALLLQSDDPDKGIASAVGRYSEDGTAFGYPRYKLDSEKTKYLYRSETKGQWTVSVHIRTILVRSIFSALPYH